MSNNFFDIFQSNAYSNINNDIIRSNLLYLTNYDISVSFTTKFTEIITNINHDNPLIIIELGSFNGLTACTMAKIAKENNISCKIICIDIWEYSREFWLKILNDNNDFLNNTPVINNSSYSQIYNIFINNVVFQNHTDMIIPIFTPPNLVIELLNSTNIIPDIIFINCELNNDLLKNNINQYWNILNSNHGELLGNNYIIDNNTFIEVNKLANSSNLTINTNNDIWNIKKKNI
jgi:hypothetical protein